MKWNVQNLPYQEVYSTGQEFHFQTEMLEVGFKGFFYRFEQLQEVTAEMELPEFWKLTMDEPAIIIHHLYNKQIQPDGFHLKIESPLEINIETRDLRGFRYGLKALMRVMRKEDEHIYLIKAEIKHEPSFAWRGVIEGFYGKPWKLEDRLDVLDFLEKNAMNTYMYAPKDDEYQRMRWRERYPEEKVAEFDTLLKAAHAKNIDFYYMISPGNDIDYSKESEVLVLTNKLQQMIDLGFTCFGLLLDDIDYLLKGAIRKKFRAAAHAHAYLINQVNLFLKGELAEYRLIVCPTEYDNAFGSAYLETLTKETAPEVPFFWTGPSTLAAAITTEDITRMSEVYQRPMVIWDNVPVNDYQSDSELVFLSPYENRSPKLADSAFQVKGIVSNPMPQWELSKIMVGTMGNFLWDCQHYRSSESLKRVLEELYGKESVVPMQKLLDFHPNHYMREPYPSSLLQKVKKKEDLWIKEQLFELVEAGRKLESILPENTKRQLSPWLKRAEYEWRVWGEIENGQLARAESLLQQLEEGTERLGVSFVTKYLEIHKAAETDFLSIGRTEV